MRHDFPVSYCAGHLSLSGKGRSNLIFSRMIPVAPGVVAPSGVLMIGLALVLRDLVQRSLGIGWALPAVLVGASLSALLAAPNLVLASGAAFLLSELADTAVYTPLQRRRFMWAVVL